MAFKDVMMKVRRIILCGRKEERKPSLEIGCPTDVRRMDISDTIPGLTSADKKMIKERASNDAIRLFSLQSHPPTRPPSPHSSSLPPSTPSSRDPSQPLLNAASTDLPPTLPTPPRQKHSEASPPAFRMKSMWDRTRRLSSGLGSSYQHQHQRHRSSSGYHELELELDTDTDADADVDAANTGAGANADAGVGVSGGESVLMLDVDVDVDLDLDLDFKGEGMRLDSPVSVAGSMKSGIEGEGEGFEVQDVVGGRLGAEAEERDFALGKAIRDMDMDMEAVGVESSDSDSEGEVGAGAGAAERKRLVRD
ncbi:hypothetical protein CC80DRAFT_548920 [Byssothecium circinans]|uniref:Uncharacterized protein n=1 Tax=Byssothecium circinans TaxID=147558 RepID=A0A6A5TT81_9PLEO|nr:hypothetical protein CC80DRAFT_548920 [Byssothecium circinans]